MRRHGPSPGPRENATPSTAGPSLSAVSAARSSTVSTTAGMASPMCSAASRGWMPPLSGWYGSDSMITSSVAVSKSAALAAHAVPSIPTMRIENEVTARCEAESGFLGFRLGFAVFGFDLVPVEHVVLFDVAGELRRLVHLRVAG